MMGLLWDLLQDLYWEMYLWCNKKTHWFPDYINMSKKWRRYIKDAFAYLRN